MSCAGLVPALRLAEAAGLYETPSGLTVASPNAAAKTAAVIGGMLAGADSIGVRGLNIQLATINTPTAAPVIARARLRKGNTTSATGAGRLLAQALTTAHAAG